MHPRNRYSREKPDFAALAKSHPPLQEHLVWKSDDYATLDFKNPSAQKELTRAILKQDFHLNVDMPVDKLIPTVPQKLNYIHWIEDLLSGGNADSIPRGEGITGIDIGTGTTCIYPLLATCLNKWSFVATDTDAVSLEYAIKNVSTNGMQDRIRVKGVDPETMLVGVVREEQFDFCMCNPPFYGVDEDHHGDQRPPPPHSSCSGQAHEVKVHGGEVEFVSRMVEESLLLRCRVRWFTSMVGKKKSLKPLRALLRRRQVPAVTTTEFVQGVTKRWAIAWSFTEQVPCRPSPPCIVPLVGSSSTADGRAHAVQWLERLLGHMESADPIHHEALVVAIPSLSYYLDLPGIITNKCRKIHFTQKDQEGYTCTAEKATWANQRRKRRLLQQQLRSAETVAKRPCGGSDNTRGDVTGNDLNTLVSVAHLLPKANSLERNASSDLAAQLSALTPPYRVSFWCGVQPCVAASTSKAELELTLVLIDGGSGPQPLQPIAQYMKNNWSAADSGHTSDRCKS